MKNAWNAPIAQRMELAFVVPNSERGPLVDHVKNLRPLTDLVLPPSTRQVLERVLAENHRTAELAARGLRASNRLLFCGPPGCGKTIAAGAVLAKRERVVLFIDEVDALGRQRGLQGAWAPPARARARR